MNTKAGLAHDEVVAIVGHIEDWKIAQIVGTAATAADLREAQAGVVEKGDLEAETGRRMSGEVARLYKILMADEPEWPDSEGPREQTP